MSYLLHNWLEILNTLILLGLGIYSFQMTKKVEFLKSQLNVSTENEKWFINEQNKALIKLTEEVFLIISKLKNFPEHNQVSGLSSEKEFNFNIHEEFSSTKLNLGYLAILFEKNTVQELIESYYKILEELSHVRKVAIEDLGNRWQNAQILNEDMPEDLIQQNYRYGDFTFHPKEYYKIRSAYFKIFEEKVFGKEYKEFTEYVRNYLKSSNRSS